MASIESVKKDDFEEKVLKSTKPSLVDFWAEWCMPCKKIEPLLDQLSEEFKDKINFFKVNVDENPSLAAEYGIRGIPALFLFKNGEIVEKIIGVVGKKEILKKLKKVL
ncbi:thioredoxin [Candidatus Aerophobetes bacterium]|nr:thioredoxin [Candidatus Aerophobetes bacterium]